MAPIAAATLFRTLCIPASLHPPTISLCPLPVAFTQLAGHPSRSADGLGVDAVDALPSLLAPAPRPPSPLLCPEDPPLSTTLVRPLSVATAHFSGTSIASPVAVVGTVTVPPTATLALAQPLAHSPCPPRLASGQPLQPCNFYCNRLSGRPFATLPTVDVVDIAADIAASANLVSPHPLGHFPRHSQNTAAFADPLQPSHF
eukprot:scaffold15870_cov141-Amphora_coffeaeformis.AAC.1